MKERKAVVSEIAKRYKKAGKKQKGIILDELIALTGYNRSYACFLLSSYEKIVRMNNRVLKVDLTMKTKKKKSKYYDNDVKKALIKVWDVLDCPCGKRLKPVLPEIIYKLKEFKEIQIETDVEEKLFKISASTIDRILSEYKRMNKPKGKTYTKPGSLLKSQIPIRTFSEWDESIPGYLEIDLVGHEGGDPRGEFIHTLTAVDICTGWIEIDALKNKAQRWVFESIDEIKKRLPFKLFGIDSDNGAEFINHQLHRYCVENNITFTRSRKYRKNDNCYVEQKNYSVVRKYVGYFRYDREVELMTLKKLYESLRLYINFFQPVMKQISKERVGSKVTKRYDKAKTPYQRILENPGVEKIDKEKLREQYTKLNPAELQRQIVKLQKKLLEDISIKEEVRNSIKKISKNKDKICYGYV
ncbi:MAG: transposase [Thermodesulfobium sp.]